MKITSAPCEAVTASRGEGLKAKRVKLCRSVRALVSLLFGENYGTLRCRAASRLCDVLYGWWQLATTGLAAVLCCMCSAHANASRSTPCEDASPDSVRMAVWLEVPVRPCIHHAECCADSCELTTLTPV